MKIGQRGLLSESQLDEILDSYAMTTLGVEGGSEELRHLVFDF
jgi:hypothetical protein